MRFEELVRTSEAVKQTRSRQQKVEHLAACIAALAAEPAPVVTPAAQELTRPGQGSLGVIDSPSGRSSLHVGVAYLSGELPQGRVGLGPSAVFKSPPAAAREQGLLTVTDVDATFDAIAGVSGSGAVRERLRIWAGLLERCTPLEQTYLRHLVVGELRQGALTSLVSDAVAR